VQIASGSERAFQYLRGQTFFSFFCAFFICSRFISFSPLAHRSILEFQQDSSECLSPQFRMDRRDGEVWIFLPVERPDLLPLALAERRTARRPEKSQSRTTGRQTTLSWPTLLLDDRALQSF
jgi:hypothetical protein